MGLKMSGKGLLTQLIDGHKKIAVFPYHKFGISYVLKNFENFLKSEKHYFDYQHFVTNKNFLFQIDIEDVKKKISIAELVNFLLKNNASIPYLMQSHFSKKCLAFAGDKNFVSHNFNFDIFKFIKNLEEFILKNKKESFKLEEIENFIFNSFIKSTTEYEKNLELKYYAQWTSNSINDLKNIMRHYNDFKFIYIKRDLLSGSYAVAKRMSLKLDSKLSKKKIKKIMIEAAINRKKQEFQIEKLLSGSKKISKFMIINFNDLFLNRKNILFDICKFLEIDFDQRMLKPHLINQCIKEKSFYNSEMNDDPNEVFTINEINQLNEILSSDLKLKFRFVLDKFFIS